LKNLSHALAAHLRERDLHTALVAHVTAVANPLELPAVAFPVLHRAEDALAEQPIPLRLEGAVVDGLGLGDFAVAPGTDLLRRGELHLDPVELRRTPTTVSWKIDHVASSAVV
jgi:hypothetical protein